MGGGGAPGKQVFHGSGHIARGQLGICRGDCGVVKRSHRSRTVRTRRSGHGAGGALIVRGRLGPAGVAAELRGNRFSTEAGLLLGAGSGPPGWLVGGRGAAHRSRSVWVLPRRLWSREAACRSGPALPACCRTSPLRTRKWSSPRLVCRRRTNLTLVSSEVIEMVRF